MRVLIACEYSAVVRDAFRAKGHETYSVDLLPTEGDPAFHFVGDVLPVAYQADYWDLMIAHPPCTFMANSGAKHLYLGAKKENGLNSERWEKMRQAAEFFKALWNAPIPRIALENPIMMSHAKKIIGVEQTQIVQPWWFGHGETKATCWWLKGLRPLVATNIVEGREQRVFRMAPSEDRWKDRSRTLPGSAAAMADQWGRL